MNARLTAVCTVCGLVLAALMLSSQTPQISAQSGSGKGLFSSLKSGQMVEYSFDSIGAVIRTYEEPESKPLMRAKVKEIGHDYIVLEIDDKEGLGAIVEFRVPVYSFSAVTHVGKSTKKPEPNAPPETKPDTKKKKKN